jgi:hypothetical protein
MTREEAIAIVFVSKKGTKEDLIFSIGEKFYSQFCLMGFITQGFSLVDEKPVNTWSITERGNSIHNFYRRPTENEKLMGRYCNSLGF